MSFKRTLIAAIVFAVLLGVYLYDSDRRSAKETKETLDARVLQMGADNLDSLSIKTLEGEFQLVKDKPEADDEEGVWRLTEPIEAKADAAAVTSLINSLDSAEKRKPFEVESEENLAEYGLDEPEATLQAQATSDGTIDTLSIGLQGVGFNDYYANLETNKNEVFLVTSSLKSGLEKDLYDLRDKTILGFDTDEATSITLQAAEGKLEADKAGGAWKLDGAVKDYADRNALEDMLRKVQTGKAADFVDGADAIARASFGLDNPSIRLAVAMGENAEERVLLVGDQHPEDTRYYAKVEDADQVFLIPEDVHDELAAEFEGYRTKKLFPRTKGAYDVVYLKVIMDRGAYALNKEGGDWKFADEPDAFVDRQKVQDLIAIYAGLRIEKFVTDDAATSDTLKYGFDNPALEIVLANKDKSIRETVKIGKFDKDELGLFARREGSPSIFKVGWKSESQMIRRRDQLLEKKLARFDANDVSSILLETDDGEVESYSFEKQNDAWRGRGGLGESTPASMIAVEDFLRALEDMRYETQYEILSERPELSVAKLGDIETTFTLKAVSGSTLAAFSMTKEDARLRYAHTPDGELFMLVEDQYSDTGDRMSDLLGIFEEEEEEEE